MSLVRLQQLAKQRGEKAKEAQGIQARAAQENRLLTTEERAQFDGLFGEVDSIKEDMDRLQRSIDEDARLAELTEGQGTQAGQRAAASDGNSGGAEGEVSEEEMERRAFRAYMIGGDEGVTPEARQYLRREAIDRRTQDNLPPELRALVVGTASAGGVTVPNETRSEVIEALKAFGGMRQAGRIMTTADGQQITMPTLDDTANTGALIGEATAATETNLTFSSVTLNAYKYTTLLMKVSRELLQDSAANIPQIVADNFATRIGRITNTHYTTGDGSNKPQGFIPAVSVGKTGANTASVSVAELLDLQHSVDPAYRVRRNGRFVGWMFSDDTLRAIRGLTGTEGQPLFQASFRAGEPDLILGFPYVVNQDVADMAASAKSIAFGDFWYHVIRDVRALSIMRLNERFAEEDVVGFVGFMRTDSEYVGSQAVDAQDAIRVFQNAAS